MGYMGFGLQRWIYTQRPRKSFSKERKPRCDTLPKYEHKDFAIDYVPTDNLEEINERISSHKEEWKLKSKNSKLKFVFYICLLTVLTFAIVKLSFSYRKYPISANNYNKKPTIDQQKEEAYKLAMDYGKNYLEKGEYANAVIEFQTAVNTKPTDYIAQKALVTSYYWNCMTNNENCIEAIQYLSVLITKDSSRAYIKSRFELYMHIQDFDNADKDYELLYGD